MKFNFTCKVWERLQHRLEVYPILFVVWTALGVLTTYTIGAILNHLAAFIPAISHTGAFPPENGIFTIVVTISALLFLITTTIRFKHIFDEGERHHMSIRVLNFIGYLLGIIVVIGMLLVGAFDVSDKETLWVHYIGAFLVYAPGFLYYVIQTVIGPSIKWLHWGRWIVLVIRIILLITGSILLLLYITFLLLFRRYVNNSTDINSMNVSTLVENPLHNYATGTQWVMVTSFYALALTLIPEFYSIKLVVTVRRRHSEHFVSIPSL